MKKFASIVAVLTLLAFAASAMAADCQNCKAPNKAAAEKTLKPRCVGTVQSVVKDGKTLKSFVIKSAAKDAKPCTITVTAKTRYFNRATMKPASAGDVKVGAKVIAIFDNAPKDNKGVAVGVVFPKPAAK